MKEYFGNYLGMCINNQDPEHRGRVQIFIPHIMPALYSGWNKDGKDISLECIGDNLPNGLTSDIVDRLKLILPWAEGALPVAGTGTAGAYNPSTGNFNQTDVTERAASQPAIPFSDSQDEATNVGRFMNSISYLETTNNPTEASIPNAGNTGFFQMNQGDADRAMKAGLPDPRAGTYDQQASATWQYIQKFKPEAASAIKAGDYQTATSKLNNFWVSLPGGSQAKQKPERYAEFNKILQGNSQYNISGNSADLTDPSSAPPGSALPAQVPPFIHPEGSKVYTANDDTKSDEATLTIANPGGDGTFDNVLKQASQTAGTKNGQPIYGNSYKGNCHYAVRNLTNANLGLGADYFGPGCGSAKDAPAQGYWEKGGYYQAVSTTGYSPQPGDIAITNGGAHGHVKTYLGSGWKSDNLNDSGNNIPDNSNATVYRLTDKGRQAMIDAGNAKPEDFNQPAAAEDPNKVAADGTAKAGDTVTNKVKHTTATVPTVQDHTGMPQGMFTVPAPGAMLWVFFREGDPLFPVYFAASYGAKEWGAAQKASSPPAYGPKEDSPSEFDHQFMLKPNMAGALTFTGTITDEKDYRTVRMAHANGGYMELHAQGTVHYTPNEHMLQVGGTSYHYSLNREDWTQGTDNKVVIGDQFIIVGNASQANFDIAEKHYQKVKEINAKMLED